MRYRAVTFRDVWVWVLIVMAVFAIGWWDQTRSEGVRAPAADCYVTPQFC